MNFVVCRLSKLSRALKMWKTLVLSIFKHTPTHVNLLHKALTASQNGATAVYDSFISLGYLRIKI